MAHTDQGRFFWAKELAEWQTIGKRYPKVAPTAARGLLCASVNHKNERICAHSGLASGFSSEPAYLLIVKCDWQEWYKHAQTRTTIM
jgi:hypothetical protein